MNIFATLNAAINALSVNKGRTALTSLGITIGIAAVIAMVSAGYGAQSKIDSNFGTIGPNLIIGFSGTQTKSNIRVGEPIFTPDDAEAIRTRLAPLITGCSEIAQLPTIASNETGSYGTLLVGGYPPDVFRIRRWSTASGTLYSEENYKRQDKVCVIGHTVAEKLFANTDAVGKTIRAQYQQFKVIGVLRSKGPTLIGGDQDDIIMIPCSTLLKKISGADKCQMLLVEARSTELVDEVKRQTELILRDKHRIRADQQANFDIKTMREFANLAGLITGTLRGLIFAVASISLVVGGIGVMNIMLVSVTERTREIGIRMAIGARTSDVLNQFLAEAIILAMIGGFVGITLGAACAAAIAHFANWELTISPESIIIAVATSAAVGIFFGYYPAQKASRLDPIEALRYE